MVDVHSNRNKALHLTFRKDINGFESGNALNSGIFPSLIEVLDDDFMAATAVCNQEDGLDEMVIFFDEHYDTQLHELLQGWYSLEECTEITAELLSGHNISPLIKQMMTSKEFGPYFNNFRARNLEVDHVLDKIIESGKESLDEIDQKVLNHEK